MKLEIRNLQSSASYTIDPEGAVLGREGSKADIILRDQAVSKKHAKIYEKNGKWYLEDLASSNGTFLENRRITEPVILSPGAVFALSENQFEVVQIVNGKAALDMDTQSQDVADRQALDDLPPLGMTPGDSVDGEGKRSRQMRSSPSSRVASPAQAGADPADLGDGDEKQGFGYFVAAVPKAVAYYLVACPLMLVNPIGSIRKSVENQRFPAMGAFPLIAYGIPPMIFSSALGAIVAMLVAIIAGAGVVGTFITGIIGLVIAGVTGIVGAVICGFLVHPLGKFFINKLFKGDSDEKSRTNYYLTSLTAAPLLSIGQNIGVLITAIPVPFIGVIGPVILAAASLISIFILYTWFQHFNVAGWVTKVIMVLGVLTALGGLWNVITVVRVGIAGLGSGPSMAGLDSANLTAEQKAALEEASKAAAAAGMNVEEAAKRTQELLAKNGAGDAAQEAMKKAMEMSAKAASDPAGAQKAAEEAIKAAQEAAKNAQANAEKQAAEVEKAAKAGEKEKTSAKEREKEKEKEKAAAAKEKEKEKEKEAAEEEEAAKPAKNGKAAAAAEEEMEDEKPSNGTKAAFAADRPGAGGPSGDFQDFIQKRKEVDDAVEKDPTLLKRKDVLASYEKYLKKTYEVRGKWKKKKAKDEAGQKINDRMKDIEVFEETRTLVLELHRKIFH